MHSTAMEAAPGAHDGTSKLTLEILRWGPLLAPCGASMPVLQAAGPVALRLHAHWGVIMCMRPSAWTPLLSAGTG